LGLAGVFLDDSYIVAEAHWNIEKHRPEVGYNAIKFSGLSAVGPK